MDFKTGQVSSLQRVYLDGRCDLTEHNCDSVLKGERYSYQIAYKSSEKFFAEIVIDSPLSQFITVRSVGNVPSELPVYESDCEFCERNEPGLFPDVLFPIENNRVLIKRQNFYALWITVDLPKDTDAGDYEIKIKLKKRRRDNQ